MILHSMYMLLYVFSFSQVSNPSTQLLCIIIYLITFFSSHIVLYIPSISMCSQPFVFSPVGRYGPPEVLESPSGVRTINVKRGTPCPILHPNLTP